MKKKATVIVFPGSNCDAEAMDILLKNNFDCNLTWHEHSLSKDLDLCFIPGGFSYGDYLRSGAIAAKSKIMEEVANFAEAGGFVIGICNGFQILTEAKILPGALVRNQNETFVCKTVDILVENKTSVFTKGLPDEVKIQVAHADGMYVADAETLKKLKEEDRIAFKYKENFNGSVTGIAGIIGGKKHNILGMMPHPERTLASSDCIQIFKNLSSF